VRNIFDHWQALISVTIQAGKSMAKADYIVVSCILDRISKFQKSVTSVGNQ
jgi:hypothetical protein